jgi:hypothetical protein
MTKEEVIKDFNNTYRIIKRTYSDNRVRYVIQNLHVGSWQDSFLGESKTLWNIKRKYKKLLKEIIKNSIKKEEVIL